MYTLNSLTFFSFCPLFLFIALMLHHKSVMMMIMLLETITIALIGFIMFFHHLDLTMSIFMLLLFAGCQAAAGLALLVTLIRQTGTDKLYALTPLKC